MRFQCRKKLYMNEANPHKSGKKKPESGKNKKRGPEPERVKLTGDWGKNVGKALVKGKPAVGWPKEPKK